MRKGLVGPKGVWLATAVFLVLFATALGSLKHLSPTFDEQGFITRGLGYIRGENRHMRVGHPLGLNALNASLLLFDESVALPSTDPSWTLPNFHRPSELFLWEIGNDVNHIMFLARLPTIWLGLLLVALIGRWVKEITHTRWAVGLGLILAALDPNLLAHMRLATTDFGLTAAAFLAGFLLWRFWQQPSWRRAVWAGATFGLLQNTKFTAGLFVPLFGIVMVLFAVCWLRKKGPQTPWHSLRSPLVMLLVAYPLAAFFTLWAAYGFQIGTLSANLPTMPHLAGLTLPLSHHLEQVLDIGGRLQKNTPSFLLGSYSDSGWWYYFPIALLLKTPLPTLLLLLAAGGGWLWLAAKRKLSDYWPTLAALLIPAGGFFAFALTTDINLGYRHILPVLPFLLVFVVVSLVRLWETAPIARRLLLPAGLAASIWLIITSLWLYPNYLAFFNVFAGGPDGGWRYLVDSNLDWGQDLARLKDWLDKEGVENIWLSYFGEGRPSYYDIPFTGLDSFPPRLMNPQARPFYPHDPAPGIYAISATTLQGVHFDNHDTFAWFRDRTPLAKVGYSIFLYEVTPRGRPVELLLSGVQLDEIAPDDFARFQTNQIVPHWFAADLAFIEPGASEFWLVTAAKNPPIVGNPAVAWEKVNETDVYAIFQGRLTGERPSVLTRFSQGQHTVALLDTPLTPEIGQDNMELATAWRNESPPEPVKIFVHLLDSSGEIVTQWDGLDAAWEGWRKGDTLWQRHVLNLPPDLPAGRYDLRLGLYHPETAVRWQTGSGDDFVDLGPVELGQ